MEKKNPLDRNIHVFIRLRKQLEKQMIYMGRSRRKEDFFSTRNNKTVLLKNETRTWRKVAFCYNVRVE